MEDTKNESERKRKRNKTSFRDARRDEGVLEPVCKDGSRMEAGVVEWLQMEEFRERIRFQKIGFWILGRW